MDEHGRWSADRVRARLTGRATDVLREIANGDSARDVERHVARFLLLEREMLDDTAQVEPVEQVEQVEQVEPSPAGVSENGRNAERFAEAMRAAGHPLARARRTDAISSVGPVKDGWVVSVRDVDAEFGIVACWWGRNHFQAFVEIAGHAERTDEAAEWFTALTEYARGVGQS